MSGEDCTVEFEIYALPSQQRNTQVQPCSQVSHLHLSVLLSHSGRAWRCETLGTTLIQDMVVRCGASLWTWTSPGTSESRGGHLDQALLTHWVGGRNTNLFAYAASSRVMGWDTRKLCHNSKCIITSRCSHLRCRPRRFDIFIYTVICIISRAFITNGN